MTHLAAFITPEQLKAVRERQDLMAVALDIKLRFGCDASLTTAIAVLLDKIEKKEGF